MFELTISKASLLPPLMVVAGAVDKKQSLAILSNFLLRLKDNHLEITATDLEIEMSARIECASVGHPGEITVPAKKFIDIIRALDEDSDPRFEEKEGVLFIKQGRSLFRLTTLPAESYPISQDECDEVEFNLSREDLLRLLQSTHFAMSQQDVRVYLNGLLLEFDAQQITAVATDGHRMAVARFSCPNLSAQKILVPRKGVQELMRLLSTVSDEQVLLSAGKNHIRVQSRSISFMSKLIDSRFPAYSKAIPKNNDKQITIDTQILKKALLRIMILANERSKAVLLHLQPGQLTLTAHNQEHEEAVETLEAQTIGEELKIGLNAGYLLDVLNHFSEGSIVISMSTTETSILIESVNNPDYQYILMPMKI